jgi:hypothetical protein
LVSRKAQVTPRSSERIRKVKKKTSSRLEKKEKPRHKNNREQPGTQTSRYLYGHNVGRKKRDEKENIKKASLPFPEQPCLNRGRVKPKIRTVPGVYGI